MCGHLISPIRRERPCLPRRASSTNYSSSDHSQQCFRVFRHRWQESPCRGKATPKTSFRDPYWSQHPMFQCWRAATLSAISLIHLIMVLPLLNGFPLSTGIRPSAKVKHEKTISVQSLPTFPKLFLTDITGALEGPTSWNYLSFPGMWHTFPSLYPCTCCVFCEIPTVLTPH